MGIFGIRFLYIFFLLFTFGLASEASVRPLCQNTPLIESDLSQREFLLRIMKDKLLTNSQKSLENLSKAKMYLSNCHTSSCQSFYQDFVKVLDEQMRLSKMVRAIAQRSGLQRINARQAYTNKLVLTLIRDKKLPPSAIADFRIDGFSFSEAEKEKSLQLWQHIFVKIVSETPSKTDFATTQKKTNQFFLQLSNDLLAMNPLLAFLNEDSLLSSDKIFSVFDQLIRFNQDFISAVDGMQTRHVNTFWSYLNLTATDHEMGLVNFENYADKVITQYSRTENDLQILCSAWYDLERQQRKRILTSIGVGTAAAVVCGVGIWSGLGTVPATAICSLTVADGLWGARRGYQDAEIAYVSRFAGTQLLADGTFSEGVLSFEESEKQNLQGDIVFLINLIGVIPVAKAISTAGKGLRGTLFDLIKIPGSDVIVSTVESRSANIGYALMVIQQSEVLSENMDLELTALTSNALLRY